MYSTSDERAAESGRGKRRRRRRRGLTWLAWSGRQETMWRRRWRPTPPQPRSTTGRTDLACACGISTVGSASVRLVQRSGHCQCFWLLRSGLGRTTQGL
jgi:hypothetical protein